MNSDDLAVFLSVAEEGSITKAAKRLGYVPSNVTARIHQLETETETTLFYRHSRGMTLTATGKILVEYAQKIHHLLHNARMAVQNSDIPQGTLIIGSMETTAAVRLPKILASYHQNYPEVNMSLVTGPTSHLVQEVLEYKLDGAFISGPIEQPELYHETIFREELVLVSEPTETETNGLITKPILVFRSGCSYRARLEQWLLSEGIPNPRIMEFGTLEAIVGGVSAGLGVSLLPRSVISNLEMKGLLSSYPIPKQYGIVDTLLIYRRDTIFGAAFNTFLRILKTLTSEETQEGPVCLIS